MIVYVTHGAAKPDRFKSSRMFVYVLEMQKDDWSDFQKTYGG